MASRTFSILAALFALAMAGGPARAYGPGGSGVTVKRILLEHGETYLEFSAPPGNPDGCATVQFVHLPSTLPNFQAYLSLAMTAMSTGMKVGYWVDGCSWSSWGPTVKLYHLNVGRD